MDADHTLIKWRVGAWQPIQARTIGASDGLPSRPMQEARATLISLGDGSDAQRDLASVPHHLILDGLIMRGDAARRAERGWRQQLATEIRQLDIRDIKADGQDSEAICGWNGPGPFMIENNYRSGW